MRVRVENFAGWWHSIPIKRGINAILIGQKGHNHTLPFDKATRENNKQKRKNERHEKQKIVYDETLIRAGLPESIGTIGKDANLGQWTKASIE